MRAFKNKNNYNDNTSGVSTVLSIIDGLSKEDIKKVKKLAQEMLTKIKERIRELDHWRDKEETQSIISVMIRDLLWANLPESYNDNEISTYKQTIYEYVYNTYPAAWKEEI